MVGRSSDGLRAVGLRPGGGAMGVRLTGAQALFARAVLGAIPIPMGKRGHARKKKERDRRRHKRVESGSVSASRSHVLLDALRAAPGPPDLPVLLEEAAVLAARHRRRGALVEALELARAGERRTPRIAFEEALAAFAMADDETADEAAQAYPEVMRVLAPLLDAAAHRKVRAAPKGASDSLRRLYAAARTVEAVRAGDGKRARANAGRAKQSAVRAAVNVELPGARTRERRQAFRALPASVHALAWRCLARQEPEWVLEAPLADMKPEARNALLASVARVLVDTGASPARLTALVAEHGPQLLGGTADAWLYAAFGCLRDGPIQAGRRFDRALSLGADMMEVLRGRWLLEHGGSPRGRAVTAMRLAKGLQKEDDGRAAAMVAVLDALEVFLALGDDRGAKDARLLGRSIAAAAPASGPVLEAALAPLEARAVGRRDPARAETLADDILARDPHNVEAWRARLEALSAQGRRADLHEAVPRAVRATGRSVERLLPGSQWAAELVIPGHSTPGAVARATALRAVDDEREQVDLWPDIRAARDALEPGEIAAVDAAAMVVFHCERSVPAGAELFAHLAPTAPPESLRAMLAYGDRLGLNDALVPIAVELVRRRGDGAIAFAVMEVMLELGLGRHVQPLLAGTAHTLSHRQLTSLKARLAAPFRRSHTVTVLMKQIHESLHPEFCISEVLEEHEDDALAGPSTFGDFETMLFSLMRGLEHDPDALRELIEIFAAGPNLEVVERLKKLARRSGSDLGSILAELVRHEAKL